MFCVFCGHKISRLIGEIPIIGGVKLNINQPLVSVIMPVYNCEKYLDDSIGSVVSQRYENWELIIVDDGSKDNSVSIIKSYVEKDKRIRFYKNNTGEHGPGIARNYGIQHIKGKYTYFLDADDWIDKELLQDTVSLAEKTGADLVPFGFILEKDGKKIKKQLNPCGYFEYQDFKDNANRIVSGTWAESFELIKSSLLQGMCQNNYKTGEDICFQMDLLRNVKKVCGIDKEYYHYRIVKDSTSHTEKWDNRFMDSNASVWEKEREFLVYCGLDEDSQVIKNAAMERYTWCIYCLCVKRYPLSLREKYSQIKYVANRMNINKYKRNFDCTVYPGMRKIAKLIVKYNLELIMLIMGTWYFRCVEKIGDKVKIWRGLEY